MNVIYKFQTKAVKEIYQDNKKEKKEQSSKDKRTE